MQITAILPVSRIKYLDRVIDSLLNQTLKPQSLLVVYDGPDRDLIEARNKIVGLDFRQVLFVKSNNNKVALSIPDRRRHITSIHNQIKELIVDADWLFSIEDDGILPTDALAKLVKFVRVNPNVGMITGVELGRWGVPYVGAWRVDDVNNVEKVVSVENKTADPCVEEIDGCGLYCALIDANLYKIHDFTTSNGLGPDVNLGLFLRQQEKQNYIDWSIQVTHLTNRHGLEIEIPATDTSKQVTLSKMRNGKWAVSR